MALVTVSRSPPASGHSTPVGPTVSLAWLWSCPRSWLPVGPGGVLAAHGQPPLKPRGVRRGPSRLRLERLGGDLEATGNSDQGKIRSPERLRRPYPALAQTWAKPSGISSSAPPPLPLAAGLDLGPAPPVSPRGKWTGTEKDLTPFLVPFPTAWAGPGRGGGDEGGGRIPAPPTPAP